MTPGEKILGSIGWVAMGVTPHGWIVLAASWIMFVGYGNHTTEEWGAWVTRWAGRFVIVTVIIALFLGMVFLANHNQDSY